MPAYRYEPALIRQLDRLKQVLEANRNLLSPAMIVCGAGMIAFWYSNLLQPYGHSLVAGYPVIGLLAFIGGILQLMLPAEKLASPMLFHVRFMPQFLSQRDHLWLRDLMEDYPELKRHIQPLVDSPYPVRLDALRTIWLKRETADRRRP